MSNFVYTKNYILEPYTTQILIYLMTKLKGYVKYNNKSREKFLSKILKKVGCHPNLVNNTKKEQLDMIEGCIYDMINVHLFVDYEPKNNDKTELEPSYLMMEIYEALKK